MKINAIDFNKEYLGKKDENTYLISFWKDDSLHTHFTMFNANDPEEYNDYVLTVDEVDEIDLENANDLLEKLGIKIVNILDKGEAAYV